MHWLININTKAKCRHLHNWPAKGLCGRCLSDWRYSQSCWYFRPSVVNCCPLTFSLGQLSPSPLSCIQNIQTVYGWGGGGVLSPVETILCRSLTLRIWPDEKPTRLLDHPKQKPRRGGGLRQINTCREVPFHANFLRWPILLWVCVLVD